MNRIRVGVVGVGVAGLSLHIPTLSQMEEFELVAICDRKQAQLDFARRRWPVSHACTEFEEFLKVPGLDAVVVATPPDSHFEFACRAMSEGKHVLVEKPLARRVAECKEMVELAKRKRVCLLVGHEKRFHPSYEKVRSILTAGEIGTPFYCGVHWATSVKLDPEHLAPEGFRAGYEGRWRDPSIGGGTVHDHLPHYGDLIRHWLGVNPESVYAHNMNVARDWLGWSAKESFWEDMALVVVRFSTGFVLRFESSTVGRTLSPLWSQGSGVGEWTEYGYILGTQGQLVFDLLPWESSENGRIMVWRLKSAVGEGRGWSYVEHTEPNRRLGSPAGAAYAMFAGQLRAFSKAIAGQPHRGATGEDGTISLAMVESAYQSAKTHQECSVMADGC